MTRVRVLDATGLLGSSELQPDTTSARAQQQAARRIRSSLALAKPLEVCRLKRVAESLVAHGAPGAIVVVRDQAGVRGYAAGYASVRGKVRMTPQARFRMGSLTKTFVAMVILRLAAEGRLGIDDSVELWLPGLVPGGAQITLRQLMNHSSGLYNYTDGSDFWSSVRLEPRRVWAPQELVRLATAHRPLFPPGNAWSYSNTNYILLGLVVESVTHRTLAEALEQRIFRPLGLDATSLPNTRTMPAPFARGYLSSSNELVSPLARGRRVEVTSRFDPSWAWAAGAIVSNGLDLTRFYAALLSGQVLAPAQMAEMTRTFGDSGYGLGILTARTRCGVVWGHSGAVPGYLTVILARDGGRRVGLVMVNWESGVYLEEAAEASACAA